MTKSSSSHIRLSAALENEVRKTAEKSNQSLQDFIEATIMTNLKPHSVNTNPKFTFIDLFAGIGGMRLGFEQAGGVCIYSSEWNKYSQKTYYANFGEYPDGDITAVEASCIPDHDFLIAGFPCQPFSLAGVSKKNSLGKPTGFADKTQGTLFFDICRILKEKRPKAFLLENVKNLKSHDRGKTFKVIQESLAELNYNVSFQVIDGQYFVPQHRERILIVGFDRERYGDVQFSFDLKIPAHKPVLSEILQSDVDEKYTLSDRLWQYLQDYAAKHRKAGNGFGYGLANPDGITRTLSSRYYKDGSEILIAQENKNPRRLTPRECARLQGFPDSFIIPVSDCQAYKQFGNSVVVPLIKAVADQMLSTLKTLEDKKRCGKLNLENTQKKMKFEQLSCLDDTSDPFGSENSSVSSSL